MAYSISTSVDEYEIGQAIRSGDLQLAHIIQAAFDGSDEVLVRLAEDIEHLGGTHRAGILAEKFAKAMQEI